MTISKFMAAAVLTAALAVPGSAQSASELLQKGIYTQETAGDLDGAIQIYRQIVASGPAQHEIAAEAQYRMAQALVRKGDLTGAALEFQKLARDYSEYQALISRMATPAPSQLGAVFTRPPDHAEFDPNSPVNVSGTVTQLLWMNPRSWIHVKDAAGADWTIKTASPQELTAQQWTKDNNAVKLGDQLTVNGSLAKDRSKTVLAETVYSSDGRKLFDRANVAQVTPAEQDRLKQALQLALQQRPEARSGAGSDAYIIKPNDALFIEVFNQPSLTRPVGVRPDGKITVPIIGEMQAAGLTLNKLRDQIQEAYAGEISNPIVDVIVTHAGGQQHSVR